MKTVTMLSLVLLFLVLQINNSHEALNLSIKPDKMILLTLLGEKLELTCIYEHDGPSANLIFYKNGAHIPVSNSHGFMFSDTSQLLETNMTIDSRTLTKQPTYVDDDGVYKCGPDDDDRFSDITVDIFSVKTVSAELPENYWHNWYTSVSPLDVACHFSDISPFNMAQFTLTWEKAGTALVNGTRFSMFENGTLLIKNPGRDDMGEYQCTFLFFPNSIIDKQEFKPQPPIVTAGPAIVSHDNDKILVQGGELELSCEVSGYPMPTVTWYKSNMKINVTSRINFLEYKGARHGKFKMFALEQGDEGSYMCLAENNIAPFNASAEMTISVKGRVSAALGGKIAGNIWTVILLGCLTVTSFLKSQF